MKNNGYSQRYKPPGNACTSDNSVQRSYDNTDGNKTEKTKSEKEDETLSYGEAQVNLIRAKIFKKRTVNSPFKRWMKCTHCLSMFSTKGSLTRHLKKFNCKEASRELNSLSYLSLSEIKEAIYGSKFKKKSEEKNAVPVIHEAVQVQSQVTEMEPEKQENQPEEDSVLNCQHCNKTFMQKRTLTAHMRTHRKQKYLCPTCGKQFSYKSSLASHQIIHQEPPKSYTCNQCNAAFTTIRSLRRHHYSHYNYGDKEFICELCGKRFAYSMTLKNHKLSHSEERPHICRICGTSFKRTTHLRTHEQGVHGLHDGAVPKKYTCAICQKSMVRKESLEAHMKEHTGELNFQCNDCHKKFATNTGLNIHVAMGRCHPVVKMCDICTSEGGNSVCEHLKQKPQKRKVRLKQPEEKEKPLGKKNPTLRHLKERNYFCKICGKNYIYPCELKTHFRLAHTDEKPFVCGRCGRAFKTKASLQMHEDVHNDLRPYKCDICQKRFRKTEHIKLHIRTHTGEKPHVCNVCGRGFSQKGDMKKHILKTHNQSVPQGKKNTDPGTKQKAEIKEEPEEIDASEFTSSIDLKEESFDCDICNESYPNEAALKRHVKNAHSSNKTKCDICNKEIPKRSYKRHAKDVHGMDFAENENEDKDSDSNDMEDSTEEDKSDEQDAADPCEIFCNVEISEVSMQNFNLLFKGVDCKLCNQRYSTKKNLKKHIYNVHKMVRVKCPICDKEINKKSLERHMRTVHCANLEVKKEKKFVPDEQKIPCMLCDKKCLSVITLQNHIKNIHQAKQFKCSQCNFQGVQRVLEKHMKKEHSSEVFQCLKCQKILKSKSTLKEHMWIHTDDRRFICDICGMRFKRTSNYHGHLKSHQEKKFQCQLCGNFFLRRRYLAIHEQTIHNYYGDGVPPQEKGYQCEVCGVKLKWKNNLLAHMRIHTGEKPYKCKICGDDFTCHGSLRTHMAKHAICSTPSEDSSMFIQQAYLENRTEPVTPFPTSVIVSSSSVANKQ